MSILNNNPKTLPGLDIHYRTNVRETATERKLDETRRNSNAAIPAGDKFLPKNHDLPLATFKILLLQGGKREQHCCER